MLIYIYSFCAFCVFKENFSAIKAKTLNFSNNLNAKMPKISSNNFVFNKLVFLIPFFLMYSFYF